MPETGSEAVAWTSKEPDSSVLRKISVPTTCAYGLDSSRVSAGADGIDEVDLDDVARGVDCLVADAVGDAVAVLGAEAGGDRVRARHGRPRAGERVAGAVGEGRGAPLEHCRAGRDAGEGVRARVDDDRDVAVGVVAVRVGDGAAGGRSRVGGDREGARGGEADAVEGSDGLGAGEVVQVVGGLVGARRVVARAGEAHLVDARVRVGARRLDVVRAGLVRVDEDLAAGDVRERARLGERQTFGADGAELSTVTVRVAEVKVLPASSVVMTRRS